MLKKFLWIYLTAVVFLIAPVSRIDTESGKQIAQLEGVSGIDDVWYDAAHKRIYASGGRDVDAGFVFVYQQGDADHYELIAKVPTRPS